MPRSDTWRAIGWEAGCTAALVTPPVAISTATPALFPSASTGIDTRNFPRQSVLLVIACKITTNGTTITVTESATTNGTYTAATTSGTLTKISADGTQYVTVLKNPAKPFIRVTSTGDNAGMAGILSVVALGV